MPQMTIASDEQAQMAKEISERAIMNAIEMLSMMGLAPANAIMGIIMIATKFLEYVDEDLTGELMKLHAIYSDPTQPEKAKEEAQKKSEAITFAFVESQGETKQ